MRPQTLFEVLISEYERHTGSPISAEDKAKVEKSDKELDAVCQLVKSIELAPRLAQFITRAEAEKFLRERSDISQSRVEEIINERNGYFWRIKSVSGGDMLRPVWQQD